MPDVCVSIFMLTYNQEQFIAQAIDGVLMQETNFTCQLVIGEDFSTDRTRAICEEYALANPGRIKLLTSYRNLGLINNFIRTYKECHGKYVAICDGDDYWTDPLKLQNQVDFLEGNLNYSIVFTSFKFLFTDGRFAVKDYEMQKETTVFENLIFQNYICSATALFKNKLAPNDFPDWLDQCPYGDWPLYLWTTRKGEKIKYLSDVTAVYRREIGVSEKMKTVPCKVSKENMEILKYLKKDIHFAAQDRVVSNSLKIHRFSYLGCLLRKKRFVQLLPLSFKLILISPLEIVKLYLYILKRELIKHKN